MNDFEIAEKCLNIILENGDLYDTIALRENVKSLKHSFFRDHVFLFSRILYVGVRVCEKIGTFFSPIEKVRRAQQQLREIIGVPVDIVKSKHEFTLYTDFVITDDESFSRMKDIYQRSRHPSLSILYENSNVRIDDYVEQLKKILTFCELHNLDEIFLREIDIINLFPYLNLEDYPHTDIKKILDGKDYQKYDSKNKKEDIKYKGAYSVESTFQSDFLELNSKQLRSLIKQLEVVKVSKKVVRDLGKDIEDISVKAAIMDFLKNGDLIKLKALVVSRLSLLINSDSSYKDRMHRKAFRTVTIKDAYIRVVSTDKNGKTISDTVTNFYDFLDVPDYQILMKQISMKDDNHEVLALSALHLYLHQSIKIKSSGFKGKVSFYDYIYYTFLAKRKGRVKNIPGLYRNSDKVSKNIGKSLSTGIITFVLAAVILITGASVDFFNQIIFHKEEQNIVQNIAQMVLNPYIQSYQFEKSLIGDLFTFTNNAKKEFVNLMKSFTGDFSQSEENPKTNYILASINPLTDIELPTYYAEGYAESAIYNNGQMEYSISRPIITTEDFKDVQSEFEISVNIHSSALREWIRNNELNLPKILYPLDSGQYIVDYVLTKIYIYDESDTMKSLTIDTDRMLIVDNYISDYETSLLYSMEYPKIVFVYGIGNGMNPFIENIEKTGDYTKASPEAIRKAITRGLHLEETASDNEIFETIARKDYSLTPLKDEGLSWFIKWYGEEKYFEKIASMDSTICNLAATLSVGTNEELVYTIGYLNYDDNDIRQQEAHAWAMSSDGTLIDTTPSTAIENEKLEEDNMIHNLLKWGLENHVPLYLLVAYIGYQVNKTFGKKIRISLNIRKVAKKLSEEDIEDSYAKLRTVLYGGINVPVDRKPIQLAQAIARDFSGFTVQELQELRKELMQSEFNRDGELTSSLELVKDAQFMKQNFFKVKRKLKKMESKQK